MADPGTEPRPPPPMLPMTLLLRPGAPVYGAPTGVKGAVLVWLLPLVLLPLLLWTERAAVSAPACSPVALLSAPAALRFPPLTFPPFTLGPGVTAAAEAAVEADAAAAAAAPASRAAAAEAAAAA